MRQLVLLLAFATACAPWFPTRYYSFADDNRTAAVACIETAVKDARLVLGTKWDRIQYDEERFWRGQHEYDTRQRQEPMYIATHDELTIDVLLDGHYRINARGYHRYGNAFKGYYEEQTAPGRAAYALADFIERRCAKG